MRSEQDPYYISVVSLCLSFANHIPLLRKNESWGKTESENESGFYRPSSVALHCHEQRYAETHAKCYANQDREQQT